MEFSDKGNSKVAAALRELGVGSDLSMEKRVEILTQSLAELRVRVADLESRIVSSSADS